ncbi:MAG: hypothetical protein JOZ54_24030 [Acidobacteria bacterium]|nr:hypothetical protein [Acidobacteriota bacterium]
MLALLLAVVIDSKPCGVRFQLPAGWTTELQTSAPSHQCALAVRPKEWEGAPPLTLTVFKARTTFDQALADVGIKPNEDGLRGMAGADDAWSEAESWQEGRYVGLAVDEYVRGTFEDGRVYSGSINHIVLKTPVRRVIAFTCSGQGSDEPLDCDPTVRDVLRTLVIR